MKEAIPLEICLAPSKAGTQQHQSLLFPEVFEDRHKSGKATEAATVSSLATARALPEGGSCQEHAGQSMQNKKNRHQCLAFTTLSNVPRFRSSYALVTCDRTRSLHRYKVSSDCRGLGEARCTDIYGPYTSQQLDLERLGQKGRHLEWTGSGVAPAPQGASLPSCSSVDPIVRLCCVPWGISGGKG